MSSTMQVDDIILQVYLEAKHSPNLANDVFSFKLCSEAWNIGSELSVITKVQSLPEGTD